MTPTDCSAGPNAPAPPNRSAAAKQPERIPAREDHQCHRHEALAGRDALVPAARIVERQIGPADGRQRAAGRRCEKAHGIGVQAHCARGIRTVADHAQHEAGAGVFQGPPEEDGECGTDDEEDVHVECRLHLRNRRPEAEGDGGKVGRGGLDEGLAEIEGEARAEQHQCDADRNVIDLRKLADPAMEHSEEQSGDGGRQNAEPGRTRHHRRRIGDHGAEDERALKAEVDAAGALGERFTEAHEDEWRRDADGARKDGERHAPEADVGFHQAALFQRSGLKSLNCP